MTTAPVFSELQQYLSLTSKREKVIAANMANVDTPGYRTKDFDFQQALSQAMNSSEDEPQSVRLRKVNGLLERADGNNVDLDRESMLLAETQLQYQLGTQLLKQNFHQLLTAINGGAGG